MEQWVISNQAANFLVEGSTTKREENPASPVQDSEKSDEDIV